MEYEPWMRRVRGWCFAAFALNSKLQDTTLLGSGTAVALLVPTNTTSTAAYVAVATRVSKFDTRTPKDRPRMNRSTAADTVTSPFVWDGLSDMTTMGTIRKLPPVRATRKRASLSTSAETSLGGFPSLYSLLRSAFSSREKASHDGRHCIKTCRRGSIWALLSMSSE